MKNFFYRLFGLRDYHGYRTPYERGYRAGWADANRLKKRPSVCEDCGKPFGRVDAEGYGCDLIDHANCSTLKIYFTGLAQGFALHSNADGTYAY